MKIVIAGAGKVGFELARALSTEHDVTVIDKNEQALERLGDLIDIYPLVGDIENPLTYRTLLDRQVDLFIAVTDSDEANILSVLLANDSVEIDRKIIRLRNSYFEASQFLTGLGDLELVFPFRLSAETIRQLLIYPGANNVKQFSHTATKLISVKVDNPNHEKKEVQAFENDLLKIVAIERDKEFIIPDSQTVVMHGDLIYFLGNGSVLESLYGQLDLHMPPRIQTAVIFGAGLLGIEVAKILIEEDIDVKVVEKDISLCEKASDVLQDQALVINSHYDEAILYEEEQLHQADMVITTDRKDETNIIRALQAQENAIPKVVAVNNEHKYYSLMHQLGMVVARGPRTSVYYTILERITREHMLEKRHFCGGAGTVLVRFIRPDSLLIDKTIKPWRGDGIILLEHEGTLEVPDRQMTLAAGDLLFLITTADEEAQGKAWITSL